MNSKQMSQQQEQYTVIVVHVAVSLNLMCS